MADDKFIWIEVQGEDKIASALRVQHERAERSLKDFVDDLSTFAERVLVTSVPQRSEYLLRHIDRTSATWRPGGAGGGGEWQSIAGVKAGTSLHPIYVDQGTGIYIGKDKIRPVRARVLRFEKPQPEVELDLRYGRVRVRGISTVRYRRWVRGQKAQHYMYHTWADVVMYAETVIIRRHLL